MRSMITSLFIIVIQMFLHHNAQAQRTSLQPISSIQAREIVKEARAKLFPHDAEVYLAPKQYFRLSSQDGKEDLTIVPLYFSYDYPPQQPELPDKCGVLFKDQKSFYLVPTVGILSAAGKQRGDECSSVLSFARMPDPGPRPRLIAMFVATAPHGENFALPIILAWNASTGRYELDEKATDWIEKQPYTESVEKVRKQMLTYH